MAILGDNSQGAASSPGNSNRALVTRFTAPESGSNGTMYAYFSSGSSSGSNAKGIVYSNNAGAPDTLLANTSGVAVPSGGGLVNLGTVTATWTASTDYFVGIVYSDFQADISVDDSLSGIDTEMANGTLSYATPPGTWPGTDISYGNIRVNVWVDYSAGGNAVSVSGTGSLTATGASQVASPVNIASTATFTATGASQVASPVTISATASLTATGASRVDSPVTIASTATAEFVGASTTLTTGDFSVTSSAVLSAVGASSNSADISAASTATAQFVGASGVAADFAAASVATLTMVGAAVHSALWNGAATATVDMVGEAVSAGQGAFNINSTASVEMVGAAAAAAAAEMTGVGLASFVSTATTEETPETPSAGADSGGAGASRHYLKKKDKKRIQKNNDAFMALCQAALPHLVAAYRNSTTITY